MLIQREQWVAATCFIFLAHAHLPFKDQSTDALNNAAVP